MDIRETDPGTPEVRALLADYHAFMRATYPEEVCFLLEVDALRAPDTTFLAAWDKGTCQGIGALRITPDYAELKSMFTHPQARGKGIARAIVAQLETIATALNRPHILIETGPAFTAAQALYKAAGYRPRGPFGDYPENPHSIFLEKHLPSLV